MAVAVKIPKPAGRVSIQEEASTKATELRTQRINERRAFLTAIRDPSFDEDLVADDEVFATLIDLATSDYGVLQKDLAHVLGISPGAIARWATKENSPRPYARPAIVKAVGDLIERSLNEETPRTSAPLKPTATKKITVKAKALS
jgi:ribosome-binding protein aMBF1 (putative translation factor)